MKGIYKFKCDLRYANLSGIFVAQSEEIEALDNLSLYFGEAAGKHSEVILDRDDYDLTLISEDPEVIKVFLDNKMTTGYNPLDYIEESDEDELEDEDDEC